MKTSIFKDHFAKVTRWGAPVFIAALLLAGCGQTPPAQPSPTALTELPPTSIPQSTADIGGPRPIPTSDAAPGSIPTGAVIGPTVGTSATGGPVEGPPLSQIGTPTPQPTLMPGQDGVLVIKSADRPSEAVMSVGDTVRLELEEFYNWKVEITEPSILVVQSAQYTYKAESPGTAVIVLEGDPKCLSENPPCGAPSIGFTVKVTIK